MQAESKTQRSTVIIFQFPSNSFFQNKQVIQLWESRHFGLVVSQFMNNLQHRPMFHRVFVQTQIKPGTRFWGLELWKEKRVEVFSTSLWPNHVIPGRVFEKFGSSNIRHGRRQKCVGLSQRDHPQPTILYPSQTLKIMIHQAKLWETKLGNAPGSRDQSETRGQKCLWIFPGNKMIYSLIKFAKWLCHSLAKKIAP